MSLKSIEHDVERADAGEHHRATSSSAAARHTSRPMVLVLQEIFNGNRSWDKWSFHFKSVTEVNEWEKLKWLYVAGHWESTKSPSLTT